MSFLYYQVFFGLYYLLSAFLFGLSGTIFYFHDFIGFYLDLLSLLYIIWFYFVELLLDVSFYFMELFSELHFKIHQPCRDWTDLFIYFLKIKAERRKDLSDLDPRTATVIRRVGKRDRIIISCTRLTWVHYTERIVHLCLNVIILILVSSRKDKTFEKSVMDVMIRLNKMLVNYNTIKLDSLVYSELNSIVTDLFKWYYMDDVCGAMSLWPFGFIPGHSTFYSLWSILDGMDNGFVSVEIDLSSAFEWTSIDFKSIRSILLENIPFAISNLKLIVKTLDIIDVLISLKLTRKVLFPKCNIVSVRKQFSNIINQFQFDEGGFSKARIITVPLTSLLQGSPCSPALFNLYIICRFISFIKEDKGWSFNAQFYGDNFYCYNHDLHKLKEFLAYAGYDFTYKGTFGRARINRTLGIIFSYRPSCSWFSRLCIYHKLKNWWTLCYPKAFVSFISSTNDRWLITLKSLNSKWI